LGKLAIDYSDGVVEAGQEASKVLLQYAKDKQKPILNYPGDDYVQAYKTFYNNILGI